MRLLFVASGVGAIGDGVTGGVRDHIYSSVEVLCRRGHRVDILAAEASIYDGPGKLIPIAGNYQPSIIDEGRDRYPIIASSLIANYWRYVQAHAEEYDVVINICQDWLPYYLTPFVNVPVLHLANIGDENAVVTEEIQRTARDFPGRVGVLSRAQADALGIGDNAFLCGYGIDLALYPFSPKPEPGTLIWAARICAEKGLEDAAEIAKRAGKKLLVCGYMQDAAYFKDVAGRYGQTIEYLGFLDRPALAKAMGRAEALLCTHKWVEAFGLVVIEALACGTPVITYGRGGPAEIVSDGKTGFVVATDNVAQAAAAAAKLPMLQREDCRAACRHAYNLDAYGARLEGWMLRAVHSPR